MKKILRWRYYCEFCKKSGGSAHHMKRHEESCTNNPDRHCRFCAISGGYQEKMSVLIAALVESNSEEGLKKLRDLTEGCPGCMLSAIRQSKMQYNKDGDVYYFDGFDFEKEKESFWKEYHQNNDYPYY